jgi:hypothetical protein
MNKQTAHTTIPDLEMWVDANTWAIPDIFSGDEADEVRQRPEDKCCEVVPG